MGIAAALVMTTGLRTATDAPASAAAQSCDYDSLHNACLTIEYAGNGRWDVHVGFDRYLSRAYADGILACPGSGDFFAVLWSHDSNRPGNNLGSIPLVAGSLRSGSNPDGLFAEFSRAGMNLNAQNGTDTVVAEVTYLDCHVGAWMTYRTGTHVGTF